MDKVEKSQLYLEIATELQNQGFDLTSKDAGAIGISDKIIQYTVRKIYNIPENENINNFLINRKINKQIDFNDAIINNYKNHHQKFDPFKIY